MSNTKYERVGSGMIAVALLMSGNKNKVLVHCENTEAGGLASVNRRGGVGLKAALLTRFLCH